MIRSLVIFATAGLIALAQETGKPSKFASVESCQDALETGNFIVYQASDLSKAGSQQPGEEEYNPEAPTCFKMDVVRDHLIAVDGVAWVIQDSSVTLLRKGGVTVRRKDCRNKIHGEAGPRPKPSREPPPQLVLRPFPPIVPVVLVLKPTPPGCLVLGDEKIGFVGVPFNGIGEWWADGEKLEISGTEGVRPPADLYGTQFLFYRVKNAEGEVAECQRSWFTAPPMVVPKLSFERQRPLWSFFPVANCFYVWIWDVRNDWKNWEIDLERAGCVVGPILAVVLQGSPAIKLGIDVIRR